jgi:hypothetical protein
MVRGRRGAQECGGSGEKEKKRKYDVWVPPLVVGIEFEI